LGHRRATEQLDDLRDRHPFVHAAAPDQRLLVHQLPDAQLGRQLIGGQHPAIQRRDLDEPVLVVERRLHQLCDDVVLLGIRSSNERALVFQLSEKLLELLDVVFAVGHVRLHHPAIPRSRLSSARLLASGFVSQLPELREKLFRVASHSHADSVSLEPSCGDGSCIAKGPGNTGATHGVVFGQLRVQRRLVGYIL
jgi:hypothetical protein